MTVRYREVRVYEGWEMATLEKVLEEALCFASAHDRLSIRVIQGAIRNADVQTVSPIRPWWKFGPGYRG